MKNWVLLLAVLFIACFNVFGQEVDLTTYELVAKRGNVSVITGNNEYRMVVGSVKNPKMSLFLGVHPEVAATQMDRISKMGETNYQPGEKRTFLLCGEAFSFNASGQGEKRKYSFRGINTPVKFALTEEDVQAIKSAILKEQIESI